MYGEAGRSADDFITVYDPPPGSVSEDHRNIGLRRLEMISAALDLAPGDFERAHEAMRSVLGGGNDPIIADQRRQIVGALPDILNPLIRARIIELIALIASDCFY